MKKKPHGESIDVKTAAKCGMLSEEAAIARASREGKDDVHPYARPIDVYRISVRTHQRCQRECGLGGTVCIDSTQKIPKEWGN